jgi:hypothetical protein
MTKRGRPPTARPYEHATRAYQAMAERSTPLDDAPPEVRALVGDDPVPADARIFVGHLVALFAQVGLRSRAQYHQVKGNLVAVGAMRRLRRGTGRVPAVWLLVGEPTVSRWEREVKSPAARRQVARVEAEHHARLAVFLRDLPTVDPTLADELRMSGARTVADVLDYLRTLPPARLAGLGPGACLRFHGRAEHTCGLERSTVGAVDESAGVRLVT